MRERERLSQILMDGLVPVPEILENKSDTDNSNELKNRSTSQRRESDA